MGASGSFSEFRDLGRTNLRLRLPTLTHKDWVKHFMRTAYLILAHHQPQHLARLIKALKTPETSFFIHIDRKSDEKPFRAALGQNDQVNFIDRRVKVNWGGFSQVRATLALLTAALKAELQFHRFCLLSGADFPIKSKDYIRQALDSSQEFMRIDRRLGPKDHHSHCGNVRAYWFMDTPALVKDRLSGRIKRRPYEGITLYHGAQWWALTRNCVDYILQFLAGHPEYLSYFKYALCPDEIFFQSIVKHSPFAAQITDDFERADDLAAYFRSNQHGAHYIDWNAKVQKLPKVLELEDFDALRTSGALFARKCDEQISATLIETLESSLLAQRSTE
jgi:hypothetical protein